MWQVFDFFSIDSLYNAMDVEETGINVGSVMPPINLKGAKDAISDTFCDLPLAISNRLCKDGKDSDDDDDYDSEDDEDQEDVEEAKCYPFNIDQQYVKGDVVCEDEQFWQCLQDLCNGVDPEEENEDIWVKILAEQEESEGNGGAIEVREVSDEEVLAILDTIPLEDGFNSKMEDVILPLTIEQIWAAFYDNSAPYFVS